MTPLGDVRRRLAGWPAGLPAAFRPAGAAGGGRRPRAAAGRRTTVTPPGRGPGRRRQRVRRLGGLPSRGDVILLQRFDAANQPLGPARRSIRSTTDLRASPARGGERHRQPAGELGRRALGGDDATSGPAASTARAGAWGAETRINASGSGMHTGGRSHPLPAKGTARWCSADLTAGAVLARRLDAHGARSTPRSRSPLGDRGRRLLLPGRRRRRGRHGPRRLAGGGLPPPRRRSSTAPGTASGRTSR